MEYNCWTDKDPPRVLELIEENEEEEDEEKDEEEEKDEDDVEKTKKKKKKKKKKKNVLYSSVCGFSSVPIVTCLAPNGFALLPFPDRSLPKYYVNCTVLLLLLLLLLWAARK